MILYHFFFLFFSPLSHYLIYPWFFNNSNSNSELFFCSRFLKNLTGCAPQIWVTVTDRGGLWKIQVALLPVLCFFFLVFFVIVQFSSFSNYACIVAKNFNFNIFVNKILNFLTIYINSVFFSLQGNTTCTSSDLHLMIRLTNIH